MRWRHAWTALQQWLCAHECRLEDLQRVNPERVDCVCLKCGAALSAPYGLALPCRWVRYSEWTKRRQKAAPGVSR